jgi:hypothetical protein
MRRVLSALALLALTGPASVAAAYGADCSGPTCDLDLLAPVFAKAAMARTARGVPPVHILQIGDSHTAGDVTTGAWRGVLQAKYGIGGRGVLAPGRPYDGYLTHGITASMTPGWSIASDFGKNSAQPRPPLGLSGFSLTSTRPGAGMALKADVPDMAFDRFTLCAVGGPEAGRVTVAFGGIPQELDFTAPEQQPICRTLHAETPQMTVDIVAERASLTLTSWATFRDDGGIVLSNVGVVGSQLIHFARTDDRVVAEEMKAYRPDMIVLAFGTNEGFSPRFDPAAYEIVLRGQIARLKRLSGNAPMLLLGAPDSLSRVPSLRSNAPGLPLECAQGVQPVPPAPIQDPSTAMVQPLPPQAQATPLFGPPALGMVRRIQRRVAGEMGIAYWDWQARMGGPCSAREWVQRDVPLMRGDYVHFRSGGGAEIARRLQADLDKAAR